MDKTINELRLLIAENEVEKSLLKMQGIFSLTDSELLNDILLISARFKKLKSDVRRAILSSEQESLRHNEIINALLSLIDELKNAPEKYEQYDKVEAKIQKDAVEKTDAVLPAFLKDALVQRLAYVKQKEINIKALWIDDNPDQQSYERELLATIGVNFDVAMSSEQAWFQIKNNDYEFIISDFNRNGNPKEGGAFLDRIVADGYQNPFIFYIAALQPELGTPPYCFGITNMISDLLHYVMDVIERNH